MHDDNAGDDNYPEVVHPLLSPLAASAITTLAAEITALRQTVADLSAQLADQA